MKLIHFFENNKIGSGFQEPSESGCLGKQIKKGKKKANEEFKPHMMYHPKTGKSVKADKEEDHLKLAKKGYVHSKDEVKESFKHYTVRHKPSGKTYKVTAMHSNSAKTKAAVQHGGRSASRYSGTSDDQFEIVENIQEHYIHLEEMDMPDISDDMIGTPDTYYDEEERKEAYKDMINAMDHCRADHERESLIDGVCPNCAGSGYQDGEDEIYNDETEEYEEGNECDGWGNYGCDEGEMQNCSWTDIIEHDKKNAERQNSKDSYPGDEAVIDQIARAVKQMDDPRQMYQYMQADFPHMGRAQRSDLIAKGMKKAGLTSENVVEKAPSDAIYGIFANGKDITARYSSSAEAKKAAADLQQKNPNTKYEVKKADPENIEEGEERTDIKDLMIPKIKEYLHSKGPGSYISLEDLESDLYDYARRLTHDDLKSSDDLRNFMSNPGDEASSAVGELLSGMYKAEFDDYITTEGRIEDTFGTKTIDKHDKPEKDKKKKDEDIDLIKKLSGIKTEGRPFQNLDLADIVKLPNGKEYVFKPEKGMFVGTDGTYPGGPEEVDPSSRAHRELIRLRKNQAARLKGVKEDADGDASEVAVSKMIAKALGDENRWTEMSAAELYAELESENTDMADIVKDVAKMIYGVRLAENKTKYHDSSECSCKCGKPVCGACGRPHRPEDIKEGEGDFYNKLMNLMHDEEAYAKACGLSDEQLDQEMSEIARDRGLHMDDDREAIIMKHAEDKEEEKNKKVKEEITLEDTQDFHEEFGVLGYSEDEEHTFEAEYQGRKVKLNKPMRGDVKKFKVYVKDPKTGNVKKVNFGHGGTSAKRKTMRIRKSNPKARKSFRARHNCANPGPKTKARYWSCRKW